MSDDDSNNERSMTARDISNANLKPLPPGKSGNPAGRPKGIPDRRAVIRKFMEATMQGKKNPFDPNGSDITVIEGIMLSMIAQAQKGSSKHQTLALDSYFGKIVEKQELTGADGEPLQQAVTVNIVKTKKDDQS